MKVCLDPGHGGRDNGAAANYVTEDNWALTFVQRLGHYLRAHGAQTVITRESDVSVSLSSRAAMVVNAKCDLFISIHCNAAANPQADGAEVFYAPIGLNQNNSIGLGRELLAACKEQGLDSRGVKKDSQSQHAQLSVLRNTCKHMPAVLLEVGFVTNQHDAGLMANKVWRERLAAACAEAIVRE